MKEFNAYLFDADGTLIDTRELICRSYIHMAEAIGVEAPRRERIEATTGLPVRRQLEALLGPDRGDDFYRRAADAYGDFLMRVYPEYLRPFPGVREGLAALTACGKKLAVVTSRRRHSLDLFLEETGLAEFLPVRVTPEDTEKHKPDAEPALFAMRALGAGPHETVFVGDAEFDMGCGHAAGATTVLVGWSGMDWRGWPVPPDCIVERFEELLPDEG